MRKIHSKSLTSEQDKGMKWTKNSRVLLYLECCLKSGLSHSNPQFFVKEQKLPVIQLNEDTLFLCSQQSTLDKKENTLACFSRKSSIDLCSREKKCDSSLKEDPFSRTRQRQKRTGPPSIAVSLNKFQRTILWFEIISLCVSTSYTERERESWILLFIFSAMFCAIRA